MTNEVGLFLQCVNLLARSREVDKLQGPQKGGLFGRLGPLTRCDTELTARMPFFFSTVSPLLSEGPPSRSGPSESSLNPLVSHCTCSSSSVPVKRGGTYCIRRERRTVLRGKPAASASGTGATLRRTRGRAHREERKSRKPEAA